MVPPTMDQTLLHQLVIKKMSHPIDVLKGQSDGNSPSVETLSEHSELYWVDRTGSLYYLPKKRARKIAGAERLEDRQEMLPSDTAQQF